MERFNENVSTGVGFIFSLSGFLQIHFSSFPFYEPAFLVNIDTTFSRGEPRAHILVLQGHLLERSIKKMGSSDSLQDLKQIINLFVWDENCPTQVSAVPLVGPYSI